MQFTDICPMFVKVYNNNQSMKLQYLFFKGRKIPLSNGLDTKTKKAQCRKITIAALEQISPLEEVLWIREFYDVVGNLRNFGVEITLIDKYITIHYSPVDDSYAVEIKPCNTITENERDQND